MEVERLEDEVLRLAVEDRDTTLVTAWCISYEDTVSCQISGIDSLLDLCILEYARVQVGLRHNPQVGLKPAITSVADIIRSESNIFPRSPIRYPHPHIMGRTLTHTRAAGPFYPPPHSPTDPSAARHLFCSFTTVPTIPTV